MNPSRTTGSPRIDLEARGDRDAAALADEDGRSPERGLERPRGRLGRRVVDRRQARPAAAEIRDGRRHAGRGDRLDEGPEPLEDPVGILVGDEPAADLGVGMGRDDRLRPVALEPAPDAVDVEGRPAPAPLERRVADLADERRHAELASERLLVERQGGDRRALERRSAATTSS